ncbi:dethiobiotin synthetase [Halorientalis persicus]|jgi:dethiobiotin synthetase|uniref:ATP-dependent dethiobiotin synthetase BioD n=1 Tax=Halorientalis persicus TaxID=1367881 RepID=A0A1H8URZ1_9EURY|nr:dethiobiotin synthase [Halorientalis persicus]SEP05358.1 dethiobiotin synthetase [Halorientalis persicus]
MSDEFDDITDFAVVGTDTGVGKTVVTAGLVGWLRESGVDARAVKPCQTGFPPDDDAGFVAEACGDDAAATCLRRLEPALAPAVAAEQADVDLSYESILSECRDALADAAVGVVEGIGGLRVPLAGGREVVDLVADLDVPALVVARSGLGTLNHTALTVETLRARGVPVAGVVLNEYAGETTAERTNPDVIAGMTGVSIETVPPLSLTEPSDAVAGVANHLSRSVFPRE